MQNAAQLLAQKSGMTNFFSRWFIFVLMAIYFACNRLLLSTGEWLKLRPKRKIKIINKLRAA